MNLKTAHSAWAAEKAIPFLNNKKHKKNNSNNFSSTKAIGGVSKVLFVTIY
jgi:hypothetical protein